MVGHSIGVQFLRNKSDEPQMIFYALLVVYVVRRILCWMTRIGQSKKCLYHYGLAIVGI